MLTAKQTLCCLPDTMCDQRLWQYFWPAIQEQEKESKERQERKGKQPSHIDWSFQHIAIPQADSIEGILLQLEQQLPNEPFTLFGFSLGGYLACAFACRFPERIQQLHIAANYSGGLGQQELQQRRTIISYIKKVGYGGIGDKKIQDYLHPDIKQFNPAAEKIKETIRAMDETLGKETLLNQLMGTSEREDLTENVLQLSTPIHFYCGDHDSLVDLATMKKLVDNRHHCLHTIEQCGHMLPLEQPQKLAKAFLAGFHSSAE